LAKHGIDAVLDSERGFDHGMFVPLKLMYPGADIPCVQLSLLDSLDPEQHIKLGQALKSLHNEGVLIIGSGSSFHNMRTIMAGGAKGKTESKEFNDWLIETCTSPDLENEERYERLINWQLAPHARACHPREEHLLPLHVCMGAAAGEIAETAFNGEVFGLAMSGFLWP
jgi:4,5-DOPA dioxygenase extradiol